MSTNGREEQTSPSIYLRMRWWVFAFFLLVTPMVAYAAHRAVQSNSNNVADWLPESFEETLNLYWFNEHFGTDSFLMIAWQGGMVDDPRVALLANDLRQPAELDGVSGVKLFEQVMTTDEVLQRLQLLAAAHHVVAQTEGVGAVVSALNFGPPLSGLDAGGMRGVVHRAVINKKLEAAREDYIQAGLLRESTDAELWRLSARAFAGQEIEYGRLLGEVRKQLEPVLNDAYGKGFREFEIQVESVVGIGIAGLRIASDHGRSIDG